ncbi:MAG: ATP-binding protein, partial [Cyanobacteria bacterium P01_F01_bin.53]
MKTDLKKFYRATNPSETLRADNTEDRKCYIDFASVRGGNIIGKLKKKITFLSPDEPTCVLFTGHIGCGKSTELLRLKKELEDEGFYVVYFESSEDLEMADVEIGDILLVIARRISQSLDNLSIEEPNRLKKLLQGAARVLNADVEAMTFKVPGVGDIGVGEQEGKFSLALGIGEIT